MIAIIDKVQTNQLFISVSLIFYIIAKVYL